MTHDATKHAEIDAWIAKKIGLAADAPLTRVELEAWQLARLRDTLANVSAHSPFYQKKLSKCVLNRETSADAAITSVTDIRRLPFTTPDELAENSTLMACLPASGIDRIVTLPTTGTTGNPKRVFFTQADQELMVDYIAHGLPVMTGEDDVFLILMPCERPGSVGALVAEGVERIGSRAVRFGPVPPDGSRDDEVLETIRKERVTTGLATGSTAARLALKSASDSRIIEHMRTFLLSAQYVDDADKDMIEKSWGCKVFEHYGMTEMGLGGAMACEARIGYHPREADLLFEIVNPETGEPLPEGVIGEIVFTTLTRKAMPLIRYRTGDFSRWIPGACPCGSILKRLDKVLDRKERKPY